ncbi:MAG: deoxyribose-phosphate aldolase [Prochlorococcus sp.]|jgi:deoxyribose-phosphate aldolase|nr:deoxyribose-phosphate aldolase [Prochlorococcaceae cyanobacterium ETNP2_MAG_10]MDP6203601.1 deoxyribose-phosphate aldolase [Prochlorococcaceae cyanobacterium ETNP18_MAG_14]HJM80956.1 deoxyribose-phosphate aldolase [Prochlorococcaceae cyanobacterium Fu_MAG_72]
MSPPSKQRDLPDLAPLIDQALLDPHLDQEALKQACDAARHFGFAGLCTNLIRLPAARERLGAPGPTKLIAVIAFPFGAIPSTLKQAEAEWAAANGAEALEVVPDFWALSQGQTECFAEELARLCALGLPVAVILNIAHLHADSLALAVDAAIDAGASGIQTGNGFSPAVSAADVRQLASLARGRCAIKAAGGLHTLDHSLELVEAGASRIGTSRGPELMQALRRGQA